jgi:iron-sulfur cluster assembly protein
VLTLTDPAVAAIRILAKRPGLPANSGLRIVHGDTAGGLELFITPAPGAGDQVIEIGDVRVFVQAEAADLLGGKVLSAEIAPGDDVIFRVDDRPV